MIGQTLGHYRIESQLGAGGMGVVYLAHDTTLERLVAVKVVGERLLSEPTARERFLREAKTASSLNHPHVCTVHEVGEDKGQAYIVMEYVEGRLLSEGLASGLLPDAVVRYGIQIADALAHAHERGIVHRDLKTNNVIVTPEGRIKVLDFGLAKRLPREELAEQPTRSEDSLTEGGQMVGTLHYLAPEVLRGRAADMRTDVWALGVLLYELATGDRPFQGKTRFEVTAAILEQAPRPLPGSVPGGLRSVIDHCLAKEPGERYQRGSEARAALEAVQSGSSTAEHAPRPRAFARRWLLWSGAAAAAVGLGLLASRFFASRTQSIDSIAVLPFANVGGDPETEYLSDGVTESVIGSLSRIPRLKVIAFSSVLRYKGRAEEVDEVVRDLHVGAVLTGRIAQQGTALQIRAELVDAKDRSRMWGEQYDEKLTNILSVQDDISKKIADRLRHNPTEDDEMRLHKRYTGSPEAYQLYLKGRYYWYKFTPEGYERSLEYYQQAIDKDPAYALALAGLADTYISMAVEGLLAPDEGLTKANVATKKALEIDDSLGEAHSTMGGLNFVKEMNWPAAEKEYRRALELNPALVHTHRFYALGLRSVGRWEEAIEQLRQALDLDPLGIGTNKDAGANFFWAHRYPEAIDQLNKTLEIEPNAAEVRDLLSDVLARQGRYADALTEKRRALTLEGDDRAADLLGHDETASGYHKAMRAIAREHLKLVLEGAKEGYVSPISFAQLYTVLGEKDHAFEWFEKALAERSPWLSYIGGDPQFDDLRSDPRFAGLLRRVGLAPPGSIDGLLAQSSVDLPRTQP